MSGDKVIRVTNQEELDAALEATPSDGMVIEIHSDPGKYMPIYIFVTDSRGHSIEARGESRVVAAWLKRRMTRLCARLTSRR